MRHSMQLQGYLAPVYKSVWFEVTPQYSFLALSQQDQDLVSSAVLRASLVMGLSVAKASIID